MDIVSKTTAQTRRLGETIGRLLNPGEVVALIGELGTGKTVLAQGIAFGLGVDSKVYPRSPSFVLINEYKGRVPVYHFDLYRLESLKELEGIGYEEYFYGDGVTIIEWADKLEESLPDQYLRIELSFKGKESRLIKLTPFGAEYEKIINKL